MTLKRRLEQLEKSRPEINPLDQLTDEELSAQLVSVCRELHASGVEPNHSVMLMVPECRQFCSGEPWVKDANHRIGVMLEFRRIASGLDLPNKQRVESILALGWRNMEIPKTDIDWIVNELKAVDLGPESQWFEGYLEHSGH